MLIYGKGSTRILTEKSKTSICPNCDAEGSLTLNIYSNHAHIYWIPLFPIGKNGEATCDQCKTAISKKKLPEDLKKGYDVLQKHVKPKIWQFSGVALGILIITAIVGFSKYNDFKDKEYVSNPIIGDTYEIKTLSGYSTMRVLNIHNDSIFVEYNDYEIDLKSEVASLNKQENYNDSLMYGYSQPDILQMHEDGEIFGIIRAPSPSKTDTLESL